MNKPTIENRTAAEIIKDLDALSKFKEEDVVGSESGRHIGFGMYQHFISEDVKQLAGLIGVELDGSREE